MFDKMQFMKPNVAWNEKYTGTNYAPMFRKKFQAKEGSAKLYVCGIGYAYYYINGKLVTEDLFIAPVSDYRKTLWYNVYDVTELLVPGENCMAVWCGNGWYNEEFPSAWEHDKAEWRDLPKVILQLDVEGETILQSDDTWKCQPESAVWFNGLRSGEYFDARKYDADWAELGYDDSSWGMAVTDNNPPKGVFRECKCEPIREFEVYSTKEVIKTGEQKYVFDMGQNISGYIRLHVTGKEGQLLTIRYAEQIKEDGSRELNNMTGCYRDVAPFMTDKVICSGKPIVWSPKYTYHGFRYIEIEGLEDLSDVTVESVFVHQAVDTRTEFACSNELLNKIFRAGIFSVYSNMFYMITDCPTREKLGWANDAQASCEQILTNFKAEHVLAKWVQDVRDAMREDGALPGIIPTPGWGFEWGNGPVSDGVLYELPYRIYLHTGAAAPLVESREWFDRYLDYLDTRRDDAGFVGFGLPDWACPGLNPDVVPAEMINAMLEYRFCEIAALASKLAAEKAGVTCEADSYEDENAINYIDKGIDAYNSRKAALKERIMKTWLTEDGRCSVHHQTSVAMLIYYHMYENMEPLKLQLMELLEAADFHHNCGMVGLRRLYEALNMCGLQEYAYKVVNAEGYPGYKAWFDLDATTLWEYWDYQKKEDSKNHQMYSDVMSWMVKTILGIRQKADSIGFAAVSIEPYFFEGLTFAKGSCDTFGGKVSVSWEKKEDGVQVIIDVPEKMIATFREEKLAAGHYEFLVK